MQHKIDIDNHRVGDVVACTDYDMVDDKVVDKIVFGAITAISQSSDWIEIQWCDEHETFRYDHGCWDTVTEYKILLQQKLEESSNEVQQVAD